MIENIEKLEKRIRDQKQLIADYGKDFKEFAMKQFKNGSVDYLYFEMNEYYEIADGFQSKKIKETYYYDQYYCKAEKGSFLPKHNHLQIERITMESGKLKITTYNALGEKMGDCLVNEGEEYEIPPYTRHEVEAVEDCGFTVTFQPPIGAVADE